MELTLISENKIKISLTKNDLDGYSITAEEIDYDNTETRRVFWTLFDEAKKVTGFDAAKSRIFVQIYPGRDGGCELYVSKINGGSSPYEDGISARALKRMVKRVNAGNGDSGAVYRFDSVSSLISACKRLKRIGFDGASSAFYDSEDRFYLTADKRKDAADPVLEYGRRISGDGLDAYLKEHCKLICDGDAVERLFDL